MGISIKRVYEPAERSDGVRVLVDRLWPRGLKKEDAAVDLWLRELAPSAALRGWFGHDPARWEGFRHRYASELDDQVDLWRPLAQQSRRQRVTLLFGARDEEHNNAVVLKAYLEHWLTTHGPA
ncbi:DUF488 domain-containing protein [Dyella sp. A6]|uniref:DUF488 domain-containing protein n=1 Tax=Dyella aluminiiresistens TaxID=3069105 RepID=UPI002E79544C|nr:DUF488 domain-containing protein [Dyella sp. A6]